MGRGHRGRAARRAFLVVGLTCGVSTAAAAQFIEEEELRGTSDVIQPARAARHSVKLQDVIFAGDGSISGLLVNQSSDLVRDVRLLVRYDWRWQNEREPGDDSPGRSLYFTVAGDVPALGTLPFAYSPSPPLPPRSDGTFSPSIEVAGYTEVRFKKRLRPSR